MKYSRAQRKHVLVKRKEVKSFGYACELLGAMVERRRSVTLAAATPEKGVCESGLRPFRGREGPAVINSYSFHHCQTGWSAIAACRRCIVNVRHNLGKPLSLSCCEKVATGYDVTNVYWDTVNRTSICFHCTQSLYRVMVSDYAW